MQAEGSASGDLERIDFEHRLTAPFAVNLAGDVALGGEAPVLDVRGDWREARWPLAGDTPDYRSSEGDLRLAGTPEAYEVGVDAKLDGRELPPVTAHAEVTGSTTAARVATLRLDTLGGSVTLAGDLGWSPSPSFDLSLTGRDLDPGRQWPDLPGSLGFDVAASGELPADGPVVEVSRLELDGRLRGYPLSARGTASLAGSRVELPSLTLRSGDNRLSVEGVVDRTLALDFSVDAPALGGLSPGLAGALDASGNVAGSLQAPRVRASLHGEELRFEQHALARVDLEADVDVAGGNDSRLTLAVSDALLAGEAVRTLTLEASGGPGAHQATLSADAALADLALSLDGALGDAGWQGRLRRLEVDPEGADPWSLASPAGVRVGHDGAATLERLCLGQGEASLCLRFAQTADGALDGDLALSRLPLGVAGPWLPPGVTVEGTVEARADVAGTAASPRATFAVTPPPGAITWAAGDREPLRVAWSEFRVEGSFRDDSLASEVLVDLGELGRIAARLGLGAAGDDGGRALDGRVDANIDDLSIAAAFAPQIADPAGRIEVAAALGGRLDAPRIDGSARFSEGAVKLPEASAACASAKCFSVLPQ